MTTDTATIDTAATDTATTARAIWDKWDRWERAHGHDKYENYDRGPKHFRADGSIPWQEQLHINLLLDRNPAATYDDDGQGDRCTRCAQGVSPNLTLEDVIRGIPKYYGKPSTWTSREIWDTVVRYRDPTSPGGYKGHSWVAWLDSYDWRRYCNPSESLVPKLVPPPDLMTPRYLRHRSCRCEQTPQ